MRAPAEGAKRERNAWEEREERCPEPAVSEVEDELEELEPSSAEGTGTRCATRLNVPTAEADCSKKRQSGSSFRHVTPFASSSDSYNFL